MNSVFRARQHIMFRAIYAIARPAVCPSVTRVYNTKTVEVRIMKFLPLRLPHPFIVFARCARSSLEIVEVSKGGDCHF